MPLPRSCAAVDEAGRVAIYYVKDDGKMAWMWGPERGSNEQKDRVANITYDSTIDYKRGPFEVFIKENDKDINVIANKDNIDLAVVNFPGTDSQASHPALD